MESHLNNPSVETSISLVEKDINDAKKQTKKLTETKFNKKRTESNKTNKKEKTWLSLVQIKKEPLLSWTWESI